MATLRCCGTLVACLALAACGGPRELAVDAGDDAPDAADDVRTRDATTLDAGIDVAPRDAVAANVARDTAVVEPDFDALPWSVVGTGVAYKDSQNPRGENVFIAYAGFGVSLAQSEVWATELYRAWLRDRGVRYVYAVQGPDTIEYTHREIQNSRLIATLLPTLSPATHFIAIAGHSSGGWVACELMQQLYEGGLDPSQLTRGRTVYYDMDGVESCVDATIASSLRRAYFMSAHTDVAPGGWSVNATYMMMGAARVGSGGFHAYDASGSGCAPNAGFCLHVSLVNTHPSDPTTGLPADYADFTRGPVNTWFLSSTAADLPP